MTYFGLCPCCKRWSFGLDKRRMSCQYNDEESNWSVECPSCYEDHERVWADMWAEYYSGCL